MAPATVAQAAASPADVVNVKVRRSNGGQNGKARQADRTALFTLPTSRLRDAAHPTAAHTSTGIITTTAVKSSTTAQPPVMYHCSFCHYKSARRSTLVAHEATHQPDARLLHCSFQGCTYGALRRWQLKIHERQHTGEEPYPCPQCDKRYKVASRLSAHFKRNHGSAGIIRRYPASAVATST